MDRDPTTRELMDALIDFKGGVAGQFEGIYQRFDRVDAALAEHDKRFVEIGAKLVEHDKRFDSLEFHYGSLDRRVGRIETRLEDVERRLPA